MLHYKIFETRLVYRGPEASHEQIKAPTAREAADQSFKDLCASMQRSIDRDTGRGKPEAVRKVATSQLDTLATNAKNNITNGAKTLRSWGSDIYNAIPSVDLGAIASGADSLTVRASKAVDDRYKEYQKQISDMFTIKFKIFYGGRSKHTTAHRKICKNFDCISARS